MTYPCQCPARLLWAGGRTRGVQCVRGLGASSIPGAISKGDLDVFVGVARCRFDKSILLLGEIGFSEKQDTLRTPSLCMLESREYSYDVAVQLVENGSHFEMFFIWRRGRDSNPR